MESSTTRRPRRTGSAPRAAAIAAALFLGIAASSAQAVVVSLNQVGSFARNAPFGLAFDGTNLWWSDNANGPIRQMTTAGVDTGLITPNPIGLTALAWTGTQLAGGLVGGPTATLTLFDRFTAGNQSNVILQGTAPDHSPLDGLDFDHNQWWYSPDQGDVYRDSATGAFVGPNPFIAKGAGGFSGVERVDVSGNTFIFVVNDNFTPRQLCVYDLPGTQIGCANFVNQRYEDLAFDGRYLWAADLVGNKIDKFDVLVDGGSILETPEPVTTALMLAGLAGVGFARRRRAGSR